MDAAPRDSRMVSTTANYTADTIAAIIKDDCSKCTVFLHIFTDKPPEDWASKDTPTDPHYTDEHSRDRLAIYIKTSQMAPAQPLPQPLTAKNQKLDAKHTLVDHIGQRNNWRHKVQINKRTNRSLGRQQHSCLPKNRCKRQRDSDLCPIWPSTGWNCLRRDAKRLIKHSRMQSGSVLFSAGSTGKKVKRDNGARNNTQVPSSTVQCIFNVHFDDILRKIASFFRKATYRVRILISFTSGAFQTEMRLLNRGAGQI